MGAADLFLGEATEEVKPAPVPVKEENSEYIQLMDRLRKKEEKLSFSSLKAFSESPREFINYKLKKRTPKNEGQVLGTLCDCMLTTPDLLEKKMAIVEKMPTTDMQKKFCDDVIAGLSIDEAFSNHYKSGTAEKTYEPLKGYIEAVKAKKDIATPELKREAEKIVANLKKSELVMQYIDSCHKFQNKLEWTYKGWKFRGFTDMEGESLIIDCKYNGQGADPDKFERMIRDRKMYLQAGMYAQYYPELPDFYFIVYDKSGNFSVIKLDYTFVNYGIREYHYLVEKFDQCVKENRFNESYNFFDHSSSIRTVYKPKWVKGFDSEEEEI